ncbi:MULTISPECIES: hypothetical protein [unclassified Streptomyces]|uniref:hypothetical protein n=1 Tax=unclassified Streptomyces TaxID=2593676 RepID=UPI002E11A6A2|nr:hypothetical protein OG265_01575 [Streptomyces sp. NBC_01208]
MAEHQDETPWQSLVGQLVEVVSEARAWAARLRRVARGGRPPGFDEDRYKKRNTVERAINRRKNSRAVATRYDKRCCVFLGTVTVAALLIRLSS